jgi:hypothetical protein
MHWLGLTDLTCDSETGELMAVRFTRLFEGYPDKWEESWFEQENRRLHIRPNGLVEVPRLISRAVRYSLSRCLECQKSNDEVFRFRVTPAGLANGRKQGLRSWHLLALLRAHSVTPLPPALVSAIQRWEEQGSQAALEQAVVIRVSSPDIMKTLRGSKAGRFVGESLGPTAALVQIDAMDRLVQLAAEAGILVEVRR